MRVCILTGKYGDPRLTQVNTHVARLFGGNTCVICREVTGGEGDVPVLAMNAIPRTLPDRVLAPFHRIANRINDRHIQSPFGIQKRQIQAFLLDQRVEAALCEYGDIATKFGHVLVESGIPTFAYFRGADATRGIEMPRRARLYQAILPRLSGLFGVSQFMFDSLARHGLSHPSMQVIPSGVDTSVFLPGPKENGLFVSVGRFVEKKRPDIVIRGFAGASAAHPGARLEMLGDGPMLPACRELAATLGVSEKVIFHGVCDHDFVRARLQAAQVLLMHCVTARSGETEGVPTAIQEAMACGAVVVSTRHAGIPEIVIEGETGFLVDEGDEAGFERHIAAALAGDIDIDVTAAAARAFADERLDNRKLLRRLEAVIEEGAKR